MNQSVAIPRGGIPASIAMLQMISGFWVSQAIYIAAKLGIADYLNDTPKTTQELAVITNTHAPPCIVCCAPWLAWAYLQRMTDTSFH